MMRKIANLFVKEWMNEIGKIFFFFFLVNIEVFLVRNIHNQYFKWKLDTKALFKRKL